MSSLAQCVLLPPPLSLLSLCSKHHVRCSIGVHFVIVAMLMIATHTSDEQTAFSYHHRCVDLIIAIAHHHDHLDCQNDAACRCSSSTFVKVWRLVGKQLLSPTVVVIIIEILTKPTEWWLYTTRKERYVTHCCCCCWSTRCCLLRSFCSLLPHMCMIIPLYLIRVKVDDRPNKQPPPCDHFGVCLDACLPGSRWFACYIIFVRLFLLSLSLSLSLYVR